MCILLSITCTYIYIRMHVCTLQISEGAISMCMFKLYLSRILGQCDHQNKDAMQSGPLALHKHQPRLQVGMVLMKAPKLGKAAPYIPTFYQACPPIKPEESSISKRMQQPLAHLYFLTVLEHLLSEERQLENMVLTANQVLKQCKSQVEPPHSQVLLHIELQAVVQVIAKSLALHLDPSDQAQLGEVLPLFHNINQLLDSTSTGGGAVGGHGMVLALHMLRKLKSSHKFSELMTKKFEIVCKEVNCLKPIHYRLQVSCVLAL